MSNTTLPAELVAYADGSYDWNGQNAFDLEEHLTPESLAIARCCRTDAVTTKGISDKKTGAPESFESNASTISLPIRNGRRPLNSGQHVSQPAPPASGAPTL